MMSKTEEAEEEEVLPGCRVVGTLTNGKKWEKREYSDWLAEWFNVCANCFPEGEVDTDEVVKKTSRGGTKPAIHRPEE